MVASVIPATIRLRLGKFSLSGLVPIGKSVISAPFSNISVAVFACTLGYILSKPCAKQPIVGTSNFRQARCAATSIPYANPLTIVTSALANSCTIDSVSSFPCRVAFRVPTMLIALCGLTLPFPLA